MNRSLTLAAAGLAAALAVSPVAAADVTVSPAQLRIMAAEAVNAGNAGLANQMAEALLARDANDMDALLIGSRAARDAGDFKTAKLRARKAWGLADSPEERFAASLAMAQALSSAGQRTLAQFWLRRAGQNAPNEAARQRAIRDFRFVKSRNPWSTSLSFNVAPTSNVNGGTTKETFTIPGMDFEWTFVGTARALSGTEISAGANTRYRLYETQTSRWTLGADLSHRTYLLSSRAKRIAPSAKGSDFSNSRIGFSLSQDRLFPSSKFELSWAAGASQVWYGGAPLTQSATLGATITHALGNGQRLSYGLNHEWQQGMNGRKDARILSGNLGYNFALASGNSLQLGLGATSSHSDAAFMDYSEARVSLRYAWAKPVKGMYLSAGLNGRTRHYDSDPYLTGARRDKGFGADLTAVLPKIEYYGFVPTVTVTASKTDSNATLYDTYEYGIQWGIRSSF